MDERGVSIEIDAKALQNLYTSYKLVCDKRGSYVTIVRGNKVQCILKSQLKSSDEIVVSDRVTNRYLEEISLAKANNMLTEYKKKFPNRFLKTLTRSGYFEDFNKLYHMKDSINDKVNSNGLKQKTKDLFLLLFE